MEDHQEAQDCKGNCDKLVLPVTDFRSLVIVHPTPECSEHSDASCKTETAECRLVLAGELLCLAG